MPHSVLTDFRRIAPRYSMSQTQFRENLAAAIRAEGLEQEEILAGLDATAFVEKYSVSPEAIAQRYFEVPSLHMGEDASINDAMMDTRMRVYDETASELFRKAFSKDETPPDDIIHVTCSGYNSPSPAQRLVSEYKWPSIVTHSYHMGCAGAFPVVRMASGFMAAAPLYGAKSRVDVMHTELLSVHAATRTGAIDGESLIIRSLFGDGIIRYSLVPEGALPSGQQGLKVLSLKEVIFTETLDDMTWRLTPRKFDMTLSNRVPLVIARNIGKFAKEIFGQIGMNFEEHRRSMVFAIHPGGPKIVDLVQRFLELEDWQVRHSRSVLLDYGNMSSATVPHIWGRILEDSGVAPGTVVLSVGFGPGLAAHGMVGVKV